MPVDSPGVTLVGGECKLYHDEVKVWELIKNNDWGHRLQIRSNQFASCSRDDVAENIFKPLAGEYQEADGYGRPTGFWERSVASISFPFEMI